MSKIKKTLLGWVGDKFLEAAQIKSVEVVSEHFRIISLESPSFRHSVWRPGEKIQINTGEWNVRTYTPLSLDPFAAELKILAFIHENGPGSQWASQVQPGDSCQVLGPRPSLGLSGNPQSLFLFGDETSFAVAATFKQSLGDLAYYHFMFEVSDAAECQKVCERLDILQYSTLITKTAEGAHLETVFRELESATRTAKPTLPLLTGNAKSIQYLKTRLREEASSPLPIKTKAYWVFGKEGLD